MRKIILITLFLALAFASSLAEENYSGAILEEKQAKWLTIWPKALGIGDLYATYTGYYFLVNPSLEMVIQGEYPHCRYFSFIAHDEKNQNIATLRDSEISPDPGSVNPFLPGAPFNAEKRRYTIIIRFSSPPPGEGPAIVRGVQSARGNVLYVGTRADGKPNSRGLLIYRIYLPSKGYDSYGGVALPIIYYRRVSDGAIVSPPSKFRERTALMKGIISALGNTVKVIDSTAKRLKAQKETTTQELQWRRSPELGAENPETVYIYTRIKPDKRKLLVLRFKAPTFPDTYNNKGITGKEDVRYWSFSFASGNTMTKFTIADKDTVINPDGFVNLVIGFGANQPEKATPENGYTWVDLKGLKISSLTYRNMVVSPEFKFSAKDIKPAELIKDQLKDYLPKGYWIDPEDF